MAKWGDQHITAINVRQLSSWAVLERNMLRSVKSTGIITVLLLSVESVRGKGEEGGEGKGTGEEEEG